METVPVPPSVKTALARRLTAAGLTPAPFGSINKTGATSGSKTRLMIKSFLSLRSLDLKPFLVHLFVRPPRDKISQGAPDRRDSGA